MKKLFLIAFVVIISIGAYAQTISTLTVPTNTPTHNSCQVSGYLNATTTQHFLAVYVKNSTTVNFVLVGFVPVTGNGFGNLKLVSYNITGLPANTLHYFALELYAADTSFLAESDTTKSFTTKSTPTVGTISSVVYPQINGLMVITQTNNNTVTSVLSVKAKEYDYTGIGYPISATPSSKTKSASGTTSTDTFYLSGLGIKSHDVEVSLTPTNGAASAFDYKSSTPLVGTRPTVSGTPIVHYRFDSLNVTMGTNQSGTGNDSFLVRLYDSTGSLVYTSLRKRVNDQVTTGVFTNYLWSISYPLNKLFSVEQVVWNQYGRDSVRTGQYRMPNAPIINQVVTNYSLKATTVWVDIKFFNDDYYCPLKRTYRLERTGYPDVLFDTFSDIGTNNIIRRILLTGLVPATSYRLVSTAINCTGGVFEYPYSFTTPAGTPAPTITTSNGNTLTGGGGCAEVWINPFSVTLQPGDTATVYFLSKDKSLSLWDVDDSVVITKSTNFPSVRYTVPAFYTLDLGIQTKSKDGVFSPIASTRQTSFDAGLGGINRELNSVDSTTASFRVYGNVDCADSGTVRGKIFKGSILVAQQDVRVSRGSNGSFSIVINFNGLEPSTEYNLEVGLFLTQWTGPQSGGNRYFTTLAKAATGGGSSGGGGGTSGIVSITNLQNLNPKGSVHTIGGREIGNGHFNDIFPTLPEKQILLFYPEGTSQVSQKFIKQ